MSELAEEGLAPYDDMKVSAEDKDRHIQALAQLLRTCMDNVNDMQGVIIIQGQRGRMLSLHAVNSNEEDIQHMLATAAAHVVANLPEKRTIN